MKLTLEQIKNIAKGCARVTAEHGKIRLLRFTEEQEQVYRKANADFFSKTFATAGVRLEFTTSSRTLGLKVDVSPASSRTKFCHDVFVNGEKKYTLAADLADSTDGHMCLDGSFALGEGKKTVCIYFPWSVSSDILSIELDNGSSFSPVTHSRSMLLFGDSITHGYDAASPSESYASQLVDALDAEGCNKAIGAEKFFPVLAELPESYTPEIITVAYGTNDWAHKTAEEFDTNCEKFYKNLSALYPNAKIFALTPIWRGNCQKITEVGEFSHVADRIFEVAAALPNVTPINCFDFVPHSPEMYSPDILHPNSEGFAHYAENVISAIKGELGITD